MILCLRFRDKITHMQDIELKLIDTDNTVVIRGRGDGEIGKY